MVQSKRPQLLAWGRPIFIAEAEGHEVVGDLKSWLLCVPDTLEFLVQDFNFIDS